MTKYVIYLVDRGNKLMFLTADTFAEAVSLYQKLTLMYEHLDFKVERITDNGTEDITAMF